MVDLYTMRSQMSLTKKNHRISQKSKLPPETPDTGMPLTYKSQRVQEAFTTNRQAWRKGFITNIPDRKTMYFTGKQTSYDTAVVFRQAIKVK